MKKIKTVSFAIVVTVCTVANLNAQLDKNSDLFKTLKRQDSIFFERGFNQCDLEYLANHIANDLKFYHDQSGFQNRDSFFNNTKKYICSNFDKKPIRKVNVRSLDVFPLFNEGKLYGAIQKGEHSFYIREKGKEDVLTSIAMFTHVWLLKGEDWILCEVLSYNHQDSSKSSATINN